MRKKIQQVDKKFLWITLVLLAVGVITFISSSLGIYTENKLIFKAMMIRHLGFGVVGGLIVMFIMSKIDYTVWRKLSPYVYIAGIIITLLVFVPGIGFEHGGARRWISLGFISFQPAELLKFSVIVFLSAWFAQHRKDISDIKKGLLAFCLIVGFAILALVKQPDSGSIALIGGVAFLIYFMRGAAWKHILALCLGGSMLIGVYVAMNPYIIERIKTFSDSSRDPYGASYQIRQSRIAIGSGQIFGRGLGQSVQKFGPFLPESNSDSIFAIFAEEYGFVGGFILVFLYGLFAFFGFRVAKNAPDVFAQNLVLGIVLLVVVQVFFNIAAISGIVPLSGLPLIFMSNGGTALIVTLAEIGIVLNISRHRQKKTIKTIDTKTKEPKIIKLKKA